MRTWSFIATALALVGGVHLYFWVRLFRDPGWSRRVRVFGAIALAAQAASIPLARGLARTWPKQITQPLELLAFAWMGAAFFLLVVLLLADLGKLAAAIYGFARRASGDPPADPERRRVLATTAAAVAGVTTTGLSAVALRGGLGEVEVNELGVKLARLPGALDGLTIVQLTDVHIGMATIGTRFVEQIVERTNRLRPDAVVITGDLVDGRVQTLAREAAPLAKLAARYGVYFVTGNHEYYSGPEDWTAYLRSMGIRVLRNERAALGDDASIDLAGVDDHSGARWSGTAGGPDLRAALAGRDPDRSLILLAHQPKAIHEAETSGVELQLSGHTHGGQIWPFNNIVGLTQPYVAGLHRHGASQIYVSRGTGYWGPPMRLLAPAEITKIVLGRA